MPVGRQFGGGRMGGVALAANGLVVQDFSAIPRGPVARFILTITLSLISTAAAFNLSVSTAPSGAAEGTDDLDIVLNGVFLQWQLYLIQSVLTFAMTPAQVRTILGLLNQRDFTGTIISGSSVPVSTGSPKAFKTQITIPVTLANYFEDGNIFSCGSLYLATGQFGYQAQSSLTPTVVLANGSAVVSGLSVDIKVESGAGTEGDIGHIWKVERRLNLPTVYTFPEDVIRLGMLDTAPAATNAATAVQIGNFDLWDPVTFGSKYQNERLTAGGYDITTRCTPYLWIEPHRKFMDFAAHMGAGLRVDMVSGVSALNVYDVTAIPPTPAAAAAVASQIGGGGETYTEHPTPHSMSPGESVPASLAHLLPIRVLPGRAPNMGGNTQHASPASVAASVQKAQTVGAASRAGGFFSRMFGKG